jgi:hypothetical protein
MTLAFLLTNALNTSRRFYMSSSAAATKKNAKNGMNSMPMRPRRRRVEQTPEMMRQNRSMIEAYLAGGGNVTKCPPAYAMGSLNSTAFGLES